VVEAKYVPGVNGALDLSQPPETFGAEIGLEAVGRGLARVVEIAASDRPGASPRENVRAASTCCSSSAGSSQTLMNVASQRASRPVNAVASGLTRAGAPWSDSNRTPPVTPCSMNVSVVRVEHIVRKRREEPPDQ
jgi:hypothetical protein